MPDVDLPITNGFYVSRSLPVSAQECKNLYVHVTQGGGMADEVLYGTPGIRQLATTGTVKQQNRGAHVKDGIVYVVNGTGLYSITRSYDGNGEEVFTSTLLGAVTGSGRVVMADNGTQLLVLVPGSNGYVYNEDAGTPFQQITNPDFTASGNPEYVVFIDGYFVLSTDQKKMIVSALNDGFSYNALDFGAAEADPDGIVGLAVSKNLLYVLGAETIETFRNVGQENFPFVRIEGAAINVGAIAPFSVVNVAGTFMWIGAAVNEKPQVFVFDGGREIKVSTDGIDFLLESFTENEVAASFGWTYSENGSKFVGWTLPSTTIVYDLTSKKWHERKSYSVTDGTGAESKWRVNSVIKAYERIIVADSVDGRIGELDLDIYDEYGNEIIRTFSTMPFSNRGNPVFVAKLELTSESGVGNLNGSYLDPLVSLERSLDGKSWKDKVFRGLGKIGEYSRRLIWRRLGRAARFELFRFSISAPVKVVFIKLTGRLS